MKKLILLIMLASPLAAQVRISATGGGAVQIGGGGTTTASFPNTSGFVFNTSTTASRNATTADFSALMKTATNCNITGYTYSPFSNTCILALGITSINGNTNAAQTLVGTGSVSVSSTGGTTTINGTGGGTLAGDANGPSGSNVVTSVHADVIQAGIPVPAPPTLSTTTCGGTCFTGTYSYKIVGATSTRNSAPSVVSANVTVMSSQSPVLTFPTPGAVTTWYVFRSNSTSQGGGGWWLVTANGVAASNATYTDTTAGDTALVPFYAGFQSSVLAASQYQSPSVTFPVPTSTDKSFRAIGGWDVEQVRPQYAGIPGVGRYNLEPSSEDFPVGSLGFNNAGQTSQTMTMTGPTGVPVTLTRFPAGNYYTQLQQTISGAGLSFTAGHFYKTCGFIKSNLQAAPYFSGEQYLSIGDEPAAGPGAPAHIMIDSTPRVFCYPAYAIDSSHLDYGYMNGNANAPVTAWGSGTSSTVLLWPLTGNNVISDNSGPSTVEGVSDYFMGGLGIYDAGTATPLEIISFGTSKTNYGCGSGGASNSGNWDINGCDSWTNVASGLMGGVPFWNRATGGQTLATMVTEYATQVHPNFVAGKATYAIVEGGTNDIGSCVSSGISVATCIPQIEQSFTTLANDITTDNGTPVLVTIEPASVMNTNAQASAIRDSVNSWLLTGCPQGSLPTAMTNGCPKVLDFASVENDPLDHTVIRRDPTMTDVQSGTHPLFSMRRLLGEYVAQSYIGNTTGHPQIFPLSVPIYQPVVSGVPAFNFTLNNCLRTGTGTSAPGGIQDSGATCAGTPGPYLTLDQTTAQALMVGSDPTTSGAILVGPYNGNPFTPATFYFSLTGTPNFWSVSGYHSDALGSVHLFTCPTATSYVIPASGCYDVLSGTGNGAHQGVTVAADLAGGSVTLEAPSGSSGTVELAPRNSPALTGTPTAPTATAGTRTTQLATVEFVANGSAPLVNPTGGQNNYAPLTSVNLAQGFEDNIQTASGGSPNVNKDSGVRISSVCLNTGVNCPTSASSTVTATAGTGVTSVTCATATCTTSRGTYTIVGGTATTGTIATLAWTTTTSAWVCTTTMNGGTGFLGIGNSVATTTGMNITAGVAVTGLTVIVNYSCQP